MKAIAKLAALPGHVEVVDLPVPPVGLGDLKIKVEAVGLCGSDVSFRDWHPNIVAEFNPPLPLVLGHEFCGTVVEQGQAVAGNWVGRRVAVNPHLNCNDCAICRQGRTCICPNRKVMGAHTNGGGADYAVVRAGNAVPVPNSVSPEVGALGEPTSVALHAYERLNARAWESVAIFGAGPVGMLAGLIARALGLRQVLLVGLPADEERLRLARELGLETAVRGDGDLVAEIARWSGDEGVDMAVEATGATAAVQDAINVTKRGGRIGLLGLTHDPMPLLTTDLVFKERDLIGIRAYYASTWDKTTRLLADPAIPFEALITHRLPFEQVHYGFDLIQSRSCLKTILRP